MAVIRAVLRCHGAGDTVLPDEAYLPLDDPRRGRRPPCALNMPAYVGAGEGQGEDGTPVAGTKVISSNPGNVRRGLPRASGVTMLFDVASARITCIMEGAASPPPAPGRRDSGGRRGPGGGRRCAAWP